MARDLNKVAYEQSFTERVADLALMQMMEKSGCFGFPTKGASAIYRPAFDIAKKIVDPLIRRERNGLGERVFRDSMSPDIWTSFKNRLLMGYGQAREMHGIEEAYNKARPGLQRAVTGSSSAMGRREAQIKLDELERQYAADRERGFTAMGAVAKPRIDTARAALPVLGAAGAAGGAGLYLGDQDNQKNLEQMLQNKPLMERVKFLIAPRRYIRNYFQGGEKQSSAMAGRVLEKVAPYAEKFAPRFGSAVGGFFDSSGQGLGTDLIHQAPSLMHYGGHMLQANAPQLNNLGRWGAAGLGAAGLAGGIGGLAGGTTGGMGSSNPNLLGRARYGLHQAEKQSNTKQALAPIGLVTRPLAALAGLGRRFIPEATAAAWRAGKGLVGGTANVLGHTAGILGQPIENLGGRAVARTANELQESRNIYRQFAGQPTQVYTPRVYTPPAGPPSFATKRLGALTGTMMLGGAGVAGTAAMNPEYRQSLGQNVFSRSGLKEMGKLVASPDERSMALSQLGLPMEETGPNSQWHKPQILGY